MTWGDLLSLTGPLVEMGQGFLTYGADTAEREEKLGSLIDDWLGFGEAGLGAIQESQQGLYDYVNQFYGDLANQYQAGTDSLLQQYQAGTDDILRGFRGRTQDVMGLLEGLGTQARKDIRETFRNEMGRARMGGISRGVTGFGDAIQSASIGREAGRAMNVLEESLRAQQASYLGQLRGDELNALSGRQAGLEALTGQRTAGSESIFGQLGSTLMGLDAQGLQQQLNWAMPIAQTVSGLRYSDIPSDPSMPNVGAYMTGIGQNLQAQQAAAQAADAQGGEWWQLGGMLGGAGLGALGFLTMNPLIGLATTGLGMSAGGAVGSAFAGQPGVTTQFASQMPMYAGMAAYGYGQGGPQMNTGGGGGDGGGGGAGYGPYQPLAPLPGTPTYAGWGW